MKPAPFRYHRPASLAEALGLLSEKSDAKVIAGGQSLGPMMNMRLVTPADLVDLNAIAGMDSIPHPGNVIEIGAMTRHHQLANSAVVKERCPLLAEAAATIGHYAIRTRGTLGGSLAHADPAAQLPLVAATLGAEIVVAGKRGERRIAAKDFFVSMMTTSLAPDEIVVSVRFPKAARGERHAWQHFSRRTGDFAIVAVAVIIRSEDVRVGVGGAEDKPLIFEFHNEKSEAIPAKVRDAVNPAENPRVPALYRKELVEVLTRRALTTVLHG